MYDTGPTEEHYAFVFASANSPELLELNKRYGLTERIAGSENDLGRVRRLCAWVHGLWNYDGWNEPSAPNALTILEEAATGKSFRCTEYSLVITACANSIGLPSRVVGLLTKDCETREVGASHVVSEVFLPDLRRWVMADGQWNVVPIIGDTPLNALELHDALRTGMVFSNVSGVSDTTLEEYREWIDEYLYQFIIWLDMRQTDLFEGEKLALLPLGAKEPTVFQQRFPVTNTTYTHSARAFYPEP